eukprot:scaffold280735_cov28-Tisochrysis_lutea.AAC.1
MVETRIAAVDCTCPQPPSFPRRYLARQQDSVPLSMNSDRLARAALLLHERARGRHEDDDAGGKPA